MSYKFGPLIGSGFYDDASSGSGSSYTLDVKEDGTTKNTATVSSIDFTGIATVTETSAGVIEVDIPETTPGGLNSYVQFNSSSAFGGDSSLVWDNTNKRLGIGTSSPLSPLHVPSYFDCRDTGLTKIGYQAGGSSTAVSSFYAGYQAGFNATTAASNTVAGYQAGYSLTTGGNNTFYGRLAGTSCTGSNNLAFGAQAMQANITGALNVAIGTNALLTGTAVSSNVSIGANSLRNSTASNNVAIGVGAMQTNTIGTDNCFIGANAGFSNLSGNTNTGVGTRAGTSNSTGSLNMSLGYNAGFANVSGSSNTSVGSNSNRDNATGSFNTAIGEQASRLATAADRRVCIGYQAGYRSTTGETLVIDNRDRGSAANESANALIYGTFNATSSSQSLKFNAAVTIKHGLTLDFATLDLVMVDAGTAAATESGWVQVTIGATTGYLRMYATK